MVKYYQTGHSLKPTAVMFPDGHTCLHDLITLPRDRERALTSCHASMSPFAFPNSRLQSCHSRRDVPMYIERTWSSAIGSSNDSMLQMDDI